MGSVLPAVYGLLYTACFALAVRGLSSPLQLVLLFAMVGLSFALHLVYLPAGLCCFFSLMIAKNDVLMGIGSEKGTKAGLRQLLFWRRGRSLYRGLVQASAG